MVMMMMIMSYISFLRYRMHDVETSVKSDLLQIVLRFSSSYYGDPLPVVRKIMHAWIHAMYAKSEEGIDGIAI